MPLKKSSLPESVATLDLGSNSFHMIVARLRGGEPVVVDKLREPVRLGNGIDHKGNLSKEARQRALDCLQRFGQRLTDMPRGSVRAVGTNTLRNTNNSKTFLLEAEEALGHPIDVIAGVEEARLIYLGVAQSLATDGRKRFVMDIGGGSTELIIGKATTPKWLESLEMGCVSVTRKFFSNGKINSRNLKAARLHAMMELAPVARGFRQRGWEQAVGASGTIRATASVIRAMGLGNDGITPVALDQLVEELKGIGHIDRVELPGLNRDRAPVFIGGLVVLRATFEALRIERMEASDGALREGLLYDLIGQIHNEDTRSRSVSSLTTRYHVDEEHSQRVKETALACLYQAGEGWNLTEDDAKWLEWAARLHEIGIDIAHSRHHHHGAYIIANADLPGFTQQEQHLLSSLVLAHRRKLPTKVIKELPKRLSKPAKRMAILLRLAVILRRNRSLSPLPAFKLTTAPKALDIEFPPGWLEERPLTRADLEQEACWLEQANFKLTFR